MLQTYGISLHNSSMWTWVHGFKMLTTITVNWTVNSAQNDSHLNFVRSGPGSEQLLCSSRHQNPHVLNQICAHSTPISLSCLLSHFTYFLFFLFCLTRPHSVRFSLTCLTATPLLSLFKHMWAFSLTALSLMLPTNSRVVPRDLQYDIEVAPSSKTAKNGFMDAIQ